MKKNKILVVVSLLIISITGYAQDKTTIVVLKGSATIQKNTSEKVKLEKPHRMTLTNTATVALLANSSAIVYTSKSKIEIGGAKEQTLTYAQIAALLKKTKQETLISSFVNYLEKMYQDIEEKNNSVGETVGGASRGVGDDDYFPLYDEKIMLNDTVNLFWGKELANLVIVDSLNNDTVFNSKPLVSSILVLTGKAGVYKCTYKMNQGGRNLAITYRFIYPAKLEQEKMLKQVFDFKASINNCKDCMTEESKAILLSDFLETNNLYLK